ncbi:MAG TPA: hypothetical protein VIO12_09130 [Thermoanaerobaculia bacterium]
MRKPPPRFLALFGAQNDFSASENLRFAIPPVRGEQIPAVRLDGRGEREVWWDGKAHIGGDGRTRTGE